MTAQRVSRGEIWSINLGSSWGHEQAGARYGLVISDNRLNHYQFGVVLVVPTTTKNLDRKHPFRILIEPAESGLESSCHLMCEQLVRLDPEQRLIKKFGTLKQSHLAKVELVLARLLGIPDPEY
jgi:mRNA-degrading endonuclease toxin of MazEF toxin-antitoxin module